MTDPTPEKGETEFSLLVVEDEAFNRSLIKRHLNNEGYHKIQFAENGLEAMDRLQSDKFDLILLDIEMPEMDGVEVLEKVRADMKLRSIPVIMISAVDNIDNVVKCIELGAEDFLPKPFNPTLLRARLGASLEKSAYGILKAPISLKSEKKRSDPTPC